MQTSPRLRHPLLRFLRTPQTASSFDVHEWEALIASARRGYLLGWVAHVAATSGLTASMPERVTRHLRSAALIAQSQARSTAWEARRIVDALEPTGVHPILLKGAAYILGGIEAGRGRLLSDIDILVPRDRLDEVEKALYAHGWFASKIDAYDQRYYREWMHELPPLVHLDRGSSLDVHHTILPPTARYKPNISLMTALARPVDGYEGLSILSPRDLIIHSATHLFHDSEFDHALRDLVDIDNLARQFMPDDTAWRELVARARELDLSRPIYYALRACRRFLGTPVPDSALYMAGENDAPSPFMRNLMEIVVFGAVTAIFHPNPTIGDHSANLALFIRAHFLRMPIRLLVPHLWRKLIQKGERGN